MLQDCSPHESRSPSSASSGATRIGFLLPALGHWPSQHKVPAAGNLRIGLAVTALEEERRVLRRVTTSLQTVVNLGGQVTAKALKSDNILSYDQGHNTCWIFPQTQTYHIICRA